jgi:hypothetical protein
MSKTNSFVIKDICDHWKNYTYHHRYLDALASIFAVQNPCAAITYFPITQKFYLSYNAEATKDTHKKIGIIQQTLNAFDRIDQVEQLLFLYIAYNTDFKNHLLQDYKIFENIDVYRYSISRNEIGNISDIIQTKFDKFIANLDAIEHKKTQQHKIEQVIRIEIDTLVETINRINQPKKSTIDPEKIKSLKEQKGKGEEISKNDSYSVLQYETAINSYNHLLELLSMLDKSDKSDDFFKLSQILLRPLQDVEKVIFYLKQNQIPISSDDIMIIANPNSAHTEVNLAKEFSHLKEFYIGVSRLCCGICDYLLDDIYHHKHRGTHGTCDDGWSAPSIQFQNTFEELREKSTNFDQTTLNQQLSKQHRKLSHDNLSALLLGDEEKLSEQFFKFQTYKDSLLAGEMETVVSEMDFMF